MAEPFHRICACTICGAVYSSQRASKCPVCGNPYRSRIEDPSD